MNNKSNPTIDIRLEAKLEVEKKIIRLINSMHYFLKYVFIIFEEDGYRLVVDRVGQIITDQSYKTVKGAKIAFLKFHGYWAFNERINAKWSHAYPAEEVWLKQRLKSLTT